MNASKTLGILLGIGLAGMLVTGCGGEDVQPNPEPEPTCEDGAQNGAETDVDCGGGQCAPCALGASCAQASDCVSGLCEGSVCAESVPVDLCENGEQDDGEADVDCGGDCDPCANGATCTDGADCATGLCHEGECVAEIEDPCTNGIQDGDESDVDCGGSLCEVCGTGFACRTDDDCFTSYDCNSGVCNGYRSCMDDQKNGRETDVNCGGGICHGCPAGKLCETGDDCLSGTCEAGWCTEPEDTCSNGVKDGHETDVDCGGGVCGACIDGFYCVADMDCMGNSCEGGVCAGNTVCKNAWLDGHETDIDCGGLCRGCAGGMSCVENADCLSDLCEGNVCADRSATCGNGAKDGRETDLDCGASCDPCELGKACEVPLDCASLACVKGTCGTNLLTQQSRPESLSCTASGTVVVQEDVSLTHLVFVTEKLPVDVTSEAFWLQAPVEAWTAPMDGRFSGILAVADKALSGALGQGNRVDVVGDLVEVDCQTELQVRAASGGSISRTAEGLLSWSSWLEPEPFMNGGDPALAEPYEGTLVEMYDLEVIDTAGYGGEVGPGMPHWWIKLAGDIYVANDFDVEVALEPGDTLSTLRGVVVYRHGVYLIVPRDDWDVKKAGGGIFL